MFKIYNKSNKYSGNNSTLFRLSKILLNLYLPQFEETDNNLLNKFMSKEIKNNIIGIHAYKFGKELLNYDNINYILIIGGTDIYKDIKDKEKEEVIKKTILNASYVVCFNNFIFKKILDYYSHLINLNKLVIIQQSVVKLKENKSINLRKIIEEKTGKSNFTKIYAMIGNIRNVKNPFFLEKIFNTTLKQKNYILILIGNIIEDEIKIKNTENFLKIDPIDELYLKSLYSQINGIINCSDSEGMSNAILEAMLYKCPVYARNIEGNIAIVKDRKTGFIFSKPEEINELLEIPTNDIVNNAYEYVLTNHNFEKEKKMYMRLINNIRNE